MTFGLMLVYRRHGQKERWCGRRCYSCRLCIYCSVLSQSPNGLCEPELLVTNEGFVFINTNFCLNTIHRCLDASAGKYVWRASIRGTAVHDRSVRVSAVRLVYFTVLRYRIILYKAERFKLCSSLTRLFDSSFCSPNSQDRVY